MPVPLDSVIMGPMSMRRMVAVGTAVTCRPRTDPYVRNYRIRLLPQVRDAKRSSG